MGERTLQVRMISTREFFYILNILCFKYCTFIMFLFLKLLDVFRQHLFFPTKGIYSLDEGAPRPIAVAKTSGNAQSPAREVAPD